jgi:acetate kinase
VATIGGAARLELHRGAARTVRDAPEARDHAGALDTLIAALREDLPDAAINVVGHRIVHGGAQFVQPCRLSRDIVSKLAALTRLAPLHQPHNLAGVSAATAAFPQALQIACFDTAFHHTMSARQTAFALPWRFHEAGLRRYGFHGLSYASIARQLKERRPALANGRIVVAHLGAGASLCGMENGESRTTTMGFSTLDGLPMATRCGALDAGLVLHLLMQEGMTPASVAQLLYEESGLKGLSGISGDMRVLEADGGPAATRAIEVFVTHCCRQIAALAADLGGLDGLVFTAGIGENAPAVRAAIVAGLGFLGLRLDGAANAAGAARISADESLPVLILPCDEEGEIARAAALLHRSG